MLGRVERAPVAILPDADSEVDYVADFVRTHVGAVIVAPSIYDAIFRTWNVVNNAELFAVPEVLANDYAARALMGAYGLARQQFQRQSVWNYLHEFQIESIDAAQLQRQLRETGQLPDEIRKFLAHVVALMSPKQQTVGGYAEAAEHFLRDCIGSESERVFEALYEQGDSQEDCSREKFMQLLRESLQKIYPGTGEVRVQRSVGELNVYVGCYEGSELASLNAPLLTTMPLLTPDSRQATFPHHLLVRELQTEVVELTTSNFLDQLPREYDKTDWLRNGDAKTNADRPLDVIKSRASDEFTSFDGNLDGTELSLPRPTYVSFLDRYTTCPLQLFFDHELQIEVDDDIDETIGIAPIDRGVIVHEILHQFFVSVPPRETPDQTWTSEERQHFVAVIDAVFGQFREKAGESSTTAFWSAEEKSVRSLLASFLDDDEKFRLENGVIPAHQEIWFGGVRDDIPAVAIANGEVEIALRGRVDRIDQSVDGDRIIITDYKTGSASYAPTFRDGPIEDGELQLPVYAEAVQKVSPESSISAQQWYVIDQKRSKPRFDYDSSVREELQEELLNIANDYKLGWFPGNPGDELPWGYVNCQRCPYDRVCPADRGDAYERKVGEQ